MYGGDPSGKKTKAILYLIAGIVILSVITIGILYMTGVLGGSSQSSEIQISDGGAVATMPTEVPTEESTNKPDVWSDFGPCSLSNGQWTQERSCLSFDGSGCVGPSSIPCNTAWKCLDGVDTPLRYNSRNDVECLSVDGIACIWSETPGDCSSVLEEAGSSTVNSLSCGANHQELYGSTGYDSTKHWCSKGRANLRY